MEGVGNAGGGYFDGLGVFGCQGAIFEGGGEEVDYSKGETLFGVEGGRLDARISDGTAKRDGTYHDGVRESRSLQRSIKFL